MYSLPSPVGGWNARDARDDMPESDAVELVNWIPSSNGYLRTRNGFTEHATGLGGAVRTIAEFTDGSTEKLVAAANGIVYDATTSSTSNLGTGFSSDKWQTAATHGRLLMVNGADAPQEYDGSTLAAISGMGGSGLTVSDLIGLFPFKGRVFYWEDNARSFWYPAAGEYKNASMSEFDLSTFLTKGGKLVQGFSWTLDAGDGVDDLAVFVFSSGETLVYQGSDPGSSTDWSLIGRYQIGEPVDIRSHARLGADEVIVTKDGYESLGAALGRSRSDNYSSISSKIIGAVKDRMRQFASFTGWECFFYPDASLFVVNVPLNDTQTLYEQHALNTNLGSWTKFTGMNATTWGLFQDSPYFGTQDGKIFKADSGADDDGTAITYKSTQITRLGSRARRKILTGLNPITTFQYPEAISFAVGQDFNIPPNPTPVFVDEPSASEWDVADWDTSSWVNSAVRTTQGWQLVNASGYALTVTMCVQSSEQNFRWYATQATYKNGGPV